MDALPDRQLRAVCKHAHNATGEPNQATCEERQTMHEIPNFPFPSQTQQSAAARQELGQPIEMKAGAKDGDSKKAQGQR
jgi:hypothetical protein